MAININNLGNSNPLTKVADQNAKQQSAQSAQQTNAAPQARQDSVSITPQAQQLSKLQQKSVGAVTHLLHAIRCHTLSILRDFP